MTLALTLFFFHFHHFSFPLIKSGDVLRVSRAHSRIRVYGGRGALGLQDNEETRAGTHPLVQRKIAQVLPKFLTCFVCEALDSRCRVPGSAGGVSGGSVWLLVPAMWTLEVFSKIVGGLL